MLAGTRVTAIGFMPNGFAKSTAGEYAGNMFWIVGIALIASWIVAVVFTSYLSRPSTKNRHAGPAADCRRAALLLRCTGLGIQRWPWSGISTLASRSFDFRRLL